MANLGVIPVVLCVCVGSTAGSRCMGQHKRIIVLACTADIDGLQVLPRKQSTLIRARGLVAIALAGALQVDVTRLVLVKEIVELVVS